MNASQITTFSTGDEYSKPQPRCPYCNVKLQKNKRHFIHWPDGRSECAGSEEWTAFQRQPSHEHYIPWLEENCKCSQPIPVDITITRHTGAWCYVLGSHYCSTGFPESDDPVDVAKFINSKTAGPINVVVAL